jgi:hypothetical protein
LLPVMREKFGALHHRPMAYATGMPLLVMP